MQTPQSKPKTQAELAAICWSPEGKGEIEWPVVMESIDIPGDKEIRRIRDLCNGPD